MSIFGNNILGTWPRRYPGQVGQIEANDGMTYAVIDICEVVNQSRVQRIPALVLPTQAINLPNFTDYLRFYRDLPVSGLGIAVSRVRPSRRHC
ncbi:hypothetical protein ACFSUK_25740 [Sphingobium scionense]